MTALSSFTTDYGALDMKFGYNCKFYSECLVGVCVKKDSEMSFDKSINTTVFWYFRLEHIIVKALISLIIFCNPSLQPLPSHSQV